MVAPIRAGLAAIRNPGPVYRVGYGPDPWAWTDWSYASEGRFNGRWDSEDGYYRTIYAGNTVHGCLVEVLASFRPDPAVIADMEAILVEEIDEQVHPTASAGVVPPSWFERRRIGSADLSGTYCVIASSPTIATLRPHFAAMAVNEFGLEDFDSSALQNARPRALTQRVGRHIYSLGHSDGGPFDGVRFRSRHGEDITLWAVFEQPGDAESSSRLQDQQIAILDPGSADVTDVLALHGLTIE